MTDTLGPKRSRLETGALYREVARHTCLPEETVRLVIDTLFSIMKTALCQETKVIVRTFGSFQARRKKGTIEGVSVRFKVSNDFKQLVREALKPMEKYGVETKNEATLLAQVTGECPVCKSKLESIKPPKCPNCGTAPFEGTEESKS